MNRLKYTVGIHPHPINRHAVDAQFKQLESEISKRPMVVGNGEISLDLTRTCGCKKPHNIAHCQISQFGTQHRFLRLAFQLAKQLKKVTVLHVRN